MSFDDELEAFQAYAAAMPNNCMFLVDTYDTIEGVHKAIQVGRQLREQGYAMLGVRLDSGDLADLSIKTRQLLDEAGFEDSVIVASNDLDEYEIQRLKQQGATINIWGVGTRLATAYDQPALGGVYKLGALRDEAGAWEYKVKLSEQPIKVSNPGIQQVRRFCDGNRFTADVIFDEMIGIGDESQAVDLVTGRPFVASGRQHEDLLVPVFREGELVYTPPTAGAARRRALDQVDKLEPGVRKTQEANRYQVGLEQQLAQRKDELIVAARGTEL